jgi:hypothetical protein
VERSGEGDVRGDGAGAEDRVHRDAGIAAHKYQYFTQAEMGKLRAAGYAPPFTSLEDGIRDYVQGGSGERLRGAAWRRIRFPRRR